MKLIYATFPDKETAERIARQMVEQRLAGCANMLGTIQSIYRWDGAITTDTEVAALFKTVAERAEELVAAIAAAHPYDVPAILQWKAAAHAPYASWLQAECDETASR